MTDIAAGSAQLAIPAIEGEVEMAVVVETEVVSASQAQHDLVDERIEAVMREMGVRPVG